MNFDQSGFEFVDLKLVGTLGVDALNTLHNLEVLVIGMRGLGVEIAKNLILTRAKLVHVFDDEIVKLSDLGSNFCLNVSDVGSKKRDAAACSKLSKIKSVNSGCDVQVCQFNPFQCVDKLKSFHAVIISEICHSNFIIRADQAMRANNRILIYCCALGLSGFIFSDFGNNFIINDKNGEDCKQFYINSISKGENGVVGISQKNLSNSKFEVGDWVIFREVEGMTELNEKEPKKIISVGDKSISIDDTSLFSEYKCNGVVEEVKVAETKTYRCFRDALENPYTDESEMLCMDDTKLGRYEGLHISFQVLQDYFDANEQLPNQQDLVTIQALVNKANEHYNKGLETYKWVKNCKSFDAELVESFFKFCSSELAPITIFLGGAAAQEAIKYTGTFIPLDHWKWFDFFEIMNCIPDDADTLPKGTRYDDLTSIIGSKVLNGLMNTNVCLIGSGSIGCEILKGLALMGISCGSGTVTLIDDMIIQNSNVERSFLFKSGDIGKLKSECAALAIKEINPEIKTKSYSLKVSKEKENIFSDSFWSSQNCCINASNNLVSTKLVDSICTWNTKICIHCEVSRAKASTQIIYPFVTNCFNDNPDKFETIVKPTLTDKLLHESIHMSDYAVSKFSEMFIDSISELKMLIEDQAKFLNKLKLTSNYQKILKLERISQLLKVAQLKSFDDCIRLAADFFTKVFDHDIKHLLECFPPDYTKESEFSIWSKSRIAPKPLTYDPEDSMILLLIESYSKLTAQALSIPIKTPEFFKEYLESIQIEPFESKADKIIYDNYETRDQIRIDHLTELLLQSIKLCTLKPEEIIPIEFEPEKHMDFTYSFYNLKARTFNMSEISKLKIMLGSSNKRPQIITSSSAIAGLALMQMITAMQTSQIENFRCSQINLASNSFTIRLPSSKKETKDTSYDPIYLGPVKAIPSNWTVWDKIIMNQSMTLQELIDYFQKVYSCQISILGINNISLLLSNSDAVKHLKIEDIYREKSGIEIIEDFLVLDVYCDSILEDCMILMPPIKYYFN